jgi:hypothetical protein
MQKIKMIIAAAPILFAVLVLSSSAEAGCYRLGETGYHWYRFCVGPYWLYPHHRICRGHHCYYK